MVTSFSYLVEILESVSGFGAAAGFSAGASAGLAAGAGFGAAGSLGFGAGAGVGKLTSTMACFGQAVTGNALTAETALRVVNVGQVVLNGDRTEVTLLLTLTATDTTDGTSLHRHRALVLIDAGDKHSPTLRTLLAQFDDATRTSLDATAARRTLLLIDLGDTSLGIDMDGVELTSLDAISEVRHTRQCEDDARKYHYISLRPPSALYWQSPYPADQQPFPSYRLRPQDRTARRGCLHQHP